MSGVREMVEWDWVYTTTQGGMRLHHLAEIGGDWDLDVASFGHGVTTCGLRGSYAIPGVMSRMGMDRCARCCDKLGIDAAGPQISRGEVAIGALDHLALPRASTLSPA